MSQDLANDESGCLRPFLPDWGAYLRWPTDGQSWIHPNDLATALQMLPSRRVFQRTRWDATFYELRYGSVSIRVRPTLWLQVEPVDLSVGQQVELLSHFGINDPGIVVIADIMLAPGTHEVEFYLKRGEMRLPKGFRRSDLRPLYTRHALRPSDFNHQAVSTAAMASADWLHVGQLTDD